MNSVLISIRPLWCELIANGKKTIEVRKTKPKLKTPFKCYIYETKGVTNTPWVDEEGHLDFHGRGQVIGEFVCDEILSVGERGINHNFDFCYESLNEFGNDDIEPYIVAIKKSCIKRNELNEYGKNNHYIYAWHISNLKIYDKPKELSEFGFKKPPQSWCYVKESKQGKTYGGQQNE